MKLMTESKLRELLEESITFGFKMADEHQPKHSSYPNHVDIENMNKFIDKRVNES